MPEDLDDFWEATLVEARRHEVRPSFTPVRTYLEAIRTYDVRFPGYGGQPVRAWLHLPATAQARLPAVVHYQGYGGGRGLPQEQLLWAVAGYAHLVVDVRGQGSGWRVGDTPDLDGSAPSHQGFMTRGILDRHTYVFRRIFTDSVRAVDAVRTHFAVEPSKVSVLGASQGGGIALAVAALVPDVLGVMADVPFLCDFPRATRIADTDPYGEIVRYLKVHRDHVAAAFRTLSYFDVAVLARRATSPALLSVALMDPVCPPSTVYAAYNAYAGPKEIRVYPFNEHEGGQAFHEAEQLRWLHDLLDAA
jgi:cephalosporin-C deacetylase